MVVSIHPAEQALARAQQADPYPTWGYRNAALLRPASSLRALFGSHKSSFLIDITISDHEKWPGYTWGRGAVAAISWSAGIKEYYRNILDILLLMFSKTANLPST